MWQIGQAGEMKQGTQNPWCRGRAQGAETSEHKPTMQMAGTGSSRDKCAKAPWYTGLAWGDDICAYVHKHKGVSSGGWEKPTNPLWCRQHKKRSTQATSKLQPALQGRTGEQKHWQWSQREVGDWRQWSSERATEVAVEIDMSNIAKARRTAQRYWAHRYPETYYWTLHCPSERWRSSSINQNTSTSSPNQKTSQDSNPTPSTGTASTNQEELRSWESFIFFPLTITLFISPAYFHLHISHLQCCGVFHLCFSC